MAYNTQEAERAIMAVLLTDSAYTEQILNECCPEMFSDPDCRRIFLLAQTLDAEKTRIDLTTVHARSETGFAPRLVEISQTFSLPANLPDYINTVRDAWRYRVTGARLRECLDKAQKHDENCFADIEELRETVTETGREEERPVSALCEEAAGRFFDRERGISTGFEKLDAVLGGGLIPGRLMVLGGRPGMGKSALALNIALQAAEKGAAVLYISLEMTVAELTKRALCIYSGVDPYLQCEETEQAREKVVRAGKKLSGLRLYLRDGGDSSLGSVQGACRRVRAKEGRLDLAVIDYVGLMRTERTKTSTRQQEIAEISHGLKRLAVRMPTCVMLLSQLNREADGRENSAPRLSDLRECGDLEQDADTVLFPVRPYLYDGTPAAADNAQLYVAKNRSGRPGRIEMTWHGGTYTFWERAQTGGKA